MNVLTSLPHSSSPSSDTIHAGFTTGAGSRRGANFIPSALQSISHFRSLSSPRIAEHLRAEVIFHGVHMHFGHPVLFVLLHGRAQASGKKKGDERSSACPATLAAAACLRFVAKSYLRGLSGSGIEKPMQAQVAWEGSDKNDLVYPYVSSGTCTHRVSLEPTAAITPPMCPSLPIWLEVSNDGIFISRLPCCGRSSKVGKTLRWIDVNVWVVLEGMPWKLNRFR